MNRSPNLFTRPITNTPSFRIYFNIQVCARSTVHWLPLQNPLLPHTLSLRYSLPFSLSLPPSPTLPLSRSLTPSLPAPRSLSLSLPSTAVEQALTCAPVTHRAWVRSPVWTSFLGEIFSGQDKCQEALGPHGSPNIIWPS